MRMHSLSKAAEHTYAQQWGHMGLDLCACDTGQLTCMTCWIWRKTEGSSSVQLFHMKASSSSGESCSTSCTCLASQGHAWPAAGHKPLNS